MRQTLEFIGFWKFSILYVEQFKSFKFIFGGCSSSWALKFGQNNCLSNTSLHWSFNFWCSAVL